jgi:hypothetical protein
MNVSAATLTRLQIQFQVGVSGSDVGEMIDGRSAEWGSTQVSVQEHTGSVDDTPE